MRDLIFTYVFRPLVRPLTRLIVRLAARPALHFCFRHLPALERLSDELEKDLAEWIRGSLLLLLVTANIEDRLWQNVIPFRELLDRHEWLGVGLRIMLAVAVVQLMPDQELFTIIHPGPRLPRLIHGQTRWSQIRVCWKSVLAGVFFQHLSRSSPVFAILSVIFSDAVGWVCYGLAIFQYLIIGLVTSRDRAISVLTLFDEQMAARRHELVRQFGVISEFARNEVVFNQEKPDAREETHCVD